MTRQIRTAPLRKKKNLLIAALKQQRRAGLWAESSLVYKMSFRCELGLHSETISRNNCDSNKNPFKSVSFYFLFPFIQFPHFPTLFSCLTTLFTNHRWPK